MPTTSYMCSGNETDASLRLRAIGRRAYFMRVARAARKEQKAAGRSAS